MENLASLELKSQDIKSQPESQNVESRGLKFGRDKLTPEFPQAWLPPEEQLKFREEVENKFDSLKNEVRKLEDFVKKFKEAADSHRLCELLYQETRRLHKLCTESRSENKALDVNDACEIARSAAEMHYNIPTTSLEQWLEEISEAVDSLGGKAQNYRPIDSLTIDQVQQYEQAYDYIRKTFLGLEMNLEQGQECGLLVNQIVSHAHSMKYCWSHICLDLYKYIERELEVIGITSQEILKGLTHKNKG